MNYDGPPRDHADSSDDIGHGDTRHRIEESLKSKSSWMRVFYILVMLILYGVSRIVLGVVILFQICSVLFTGSTHKRLLDLGRSLAAYTYEIVMYVSYNSDVRPFPFDADWPSAAANDRDAATDNPGQSPTGV